MKKFFLWLFGFSKKSIADHSGDKKETGFLKCPNCNGTKWYEGPGGGSFGNIKCGSCGKCYNNLGPFGLNEIKDFTK